MMRQTMCSSCMRISNTKLCMPCKTKQHRERQARPKYRSIWGTPAWRMAREQVLKRDGYQCTKCGAHPPNATLTVHHHHYDTPLDGTSMVTLCRQCHGKQHGGAHNQARPAPTTPTTPRTQPGGVSRSSRRP